MPRGSYLYSLTIPLHLQQCIKFCWNVIKSGSSALTTASLSRTCGKLQDIKAALVNHSGRAMHVSRGVLSKMQRKAINTLRTAKSLSQGPAFLRGFVSLPCDYRQAVNISGILASPLWKSDSGLGDLAYLLHRSYHWATSDLRFPAPAPAPFSLDMKFCYTVQADFELVIFLPQPPKWWDYKVCGHNIHVYTHTRK